MRIHLKKLYVLPMVMAAVFATHISISFSAVEIQMASYASLAVTLFMFVLSLVFIIKEKSISLFSIIILLLMILVEGVSLVSNLAWKDWTYYTLEVMLLLFLFHYYRDNLKPVITGAALGFSICVYLQLCQCVLHPEMWMVEMGKEKAGYLLGGNYNSIGCRIICALATTILATKISKKWLINFLAVFASSLMIMVMVQSMTSFTCIILFVLLCIFPNKELQRYAIFTVILTAILFEIFVCFQGKGFENNDFARWFLVDILGKDMTFTYRTDMWDAALRVISKSPIWGCGNADEEWFLSEMSSFAIGPHNFILGLMINGGIIALILYIYIVIKAIVRTIPYKERYANITLAAPATLFIMMLMEYYPIQFPIYLLTLCYYYKEFREITNNKAITEEIKLKDE